jgi:hypothetical protein
MWVNTEFRHTEGGVYGICEGVYMGYGKGGMSAWFGNQVYQGLGTSFSLRENFIR